MQRWVKFAKYLPSEGWESVIYTPSNPELTSRDESLLREISPSLEIVRRPILEPYGIYHLLSGRKSSSKAEVNPINGDKKSLAQRIFLWIRANLFIPDPRVSWVRPSVRFLCRYLEDHPVDAIITTGPPHSMHLLGQRLSRRTGLPWVADFRDPWTDIFYFKFLPLLPRARRKQFSQELAVLREASAVIAVSPLVKEDFEKRSGRDVALITNGYDEEDIASAKGLEDDFFNVTHTGLFASYGIPDLLWCVLSEKASEDPLFASKLHIRLVGKTDGEVLESLRRAGLEDYVVDRGYCSHLEAVCEQKGADLLILPLRKDPEYRKVLPGKLFEYLASGRPVLGIGQSDGAMARVMDDVREAGGQCGTDGTGCMQGCFPVTVDWDDLEGLRKAVDRAWNIYLERNCVNGDEEGASCREKAAGTDTSIPEVVRKYSRSSTTAALASLLDSLI